MSPYRLAIDKTTQTIDKRAKYYRNLIVAVTFVGSGSFLWAGVAASWQPISGVLLLLPICGLYLIIDAKALNHWRRMLLIAWAQGEIDFRAFHEAMKPVPRLPEDTLNSMLETLPDVGDLVVEQGVSKSTRRATAEIVNMVHACRADVIAFKTVRYTVIGSVLIAVVAYWRWQPLLGMLAVGLLFLLQRGVTSKRLDGARKKVLTAQSEPDFNHDRFLEIVDQINWSPISAAEKETFLSRLSNAA